MSGRALYSGATNRALYSPDTNRVLFATVKVEEEEEVYLGTPTLFANYQVYTVNTGTSGKLDDVYPSVLSNLSWTWASTSAYAYAEWGSFGDKAALTYRIVTTRYDTETYIGKRLVRIRKQTAVPNYWRQQSGGGSPMWSIRVSSSANPSPGDGMSWVEGSYNRSVPNPESTEYCTLYPNVTLNKYLWCTNYIADLRPPTASGQECWLYRGRYTLWI